MKTERDHYFDNFRALLIIAVVIGHFLGPVAGQYEAVACIRKLIFLFHMPAFVFVSGYFARRNDWVKLVKTILIPYLLLQIIFYFLYNYLWGVSKPFSFLRPGYMLWFLLCLFVWRILVDEVSRIRGILPFLFIIGVLAGFYSEVGRGLSLSRMIVFFPYFLLGYQFNKETFMQWANRKSAGRISAVFLISVTVAMAFLHKGVKFKLLEAAYSYPSMELSYGWLQRGLLYLVSTLMIYAIAVLVPRKKNRFSYLGGRTMGIYILHGIIFKTITNCTDWYDYFKTGPGLVVLIFSSFGLCLLLSSSVVDRAVRLLSALPFEKLVKDRRYSS